jgi:bifunctional UDP-N-acetylglucosamine pyrophosphorylase/glucosamine-1-phosphate N-acetyltransferase
MEGAVGVSDAPVGLILAAGEGTRMGSDRPKVLLPIHGAPMLEYLVRAFRGAGLRRIVAVVGKGADDVRTTFAGADLEFVVQGQRLGTAHAVSEALPVLEGHTGEVVIAPGDAPLLSTDHVMGLLRHHRVSGSDMTIMAAETDQPAGLGRVVRGDAGQVLRIAEELDALGEERLIAEVNVGVYCVAAPRLREVVPLIGNRNRKGEYYLTDAVELLSRQGATVAVYRPQLPPRPIGVNTPEELRMAEEALRARHTGVTPGFPMSQ